MNTFLPKMTHYSFSKTELKRQIAREEDYRKPFEKDKDKWDFRLAMLDSGATTMIHNADGIEGNHKSVDDLIEEYGGRRNVDSMITSWIETIKRSKYKEKFWRYAYNKDIPNTEKYSRKWTALDSTNFEEMEESLDRGEGVVAISIQRDRTRPEQGMLGDEVEGRSERVESGHNSQAIILLGAEIMANRKIQNDVIRWLKNDCQPTRRVVD